MKLFSSRTYSYKKSRKILHRVYEQWRKQKLSEELSKQIERKLRLLEEAIFAKEKKRASDLAKECDAFAGEHFRKTVFTHGIELLVALAFALVVAILVRQSWFELYEIPTGSMRPTFREQDRLTVTKTPFGINKPLETDHFYFDPDLVQRGSAIVFSGDKLPSLNATTWYFNAIPYTRRYVKRMMGKPGDTLYFYGGKIYGVDQEGNPLTELIQPEWMQDVESIPFIRFEGEVQNRNDGVDFLYMREPLARISFSPYGKLRREVKIGDEWMYEQPADGKSLADIWGIGNYATARILRSEEVRGDLPNAELYLELKHHPQLPQQQSGTFQVRLQMETETSYLPLQQEQIDTLMNNIYTSRFVVKNGKAGRYSSSGNRFSALAPTFPGVADGTYEFYFGKAYRVLPTGILSELSKDHPLMSRDPENLQKLFNLGINWEQMTNTHRYAYYRDGDLMLFGKPLLRKGDPLLQSFLESEKKQKLPFVDRGSPVKDGEYDASFIRTHGMQVPDRHYLMLGDNHAMSGDSRVFGFVPEENLQGAPSVILWPYGPRWGIPAQKPYEIFVLPRLIVWAVAAVLGTIAYFYYKKKREKRLF